MSDTTPNSPTPGPRASGGATMKDVARAAGVSVSTASRALSGNPRIGAKTRAKVEQAAKDLNYVVNGLAQSMMGMGTKTLAFITNAFLAEPFARVARGVDDVARDHHALLMVNSTHDDDERERETIAALAKQRASGVILVGSRKTDKDYQRRLAEYRDMLAAVNATLILCGSPHVRGLSNVPAVTYDNRGGTYLATMALLAAGHRRIAFLGYDRRSTARERFLGYRDAMHTDGQYLDERSPLVFHSDNHASTLEPTTARMLDMTPDSRPTAVVCVTDLAAYGVYRLAKARGMQLPDDLSVTGFDDLATNDTVTPALSSVAVPYEQLGDYAARLAMGLPVEQNGDVVLPVTFATRESIATAR